MGFTIIIYILFPLFTVHTSLDTVSMQKENCTNGIDDDGDGLIDYMDPDCQCDNHEETLPNIGFDKILNCDTIIIYPKVLEHWRLMNSLAKYINPDCIKHFVKNTTYPKYPGVKDSTFIMTRGYNMELGATGTCLSSSIQPNIPHELSFLYYVDEINEYDDPMIGCMNIYGWYDCEKFEKHAKSNEMCFSKYDHAELLYTVDFSKLSRSKLTHIKATINAKSEIKAISMERDCKSTKYSRNITAIIDSVSLGVKQYHNPIRNNRPTCHEELILHVKQKKNNTYQWYKDGKPIQASTSARLPIINNNGEADGTYSVAIISPSGCAIIESYTLESNKTNYVHKQICRGDSIRFADKWVKEIGIYLDTLETFDGCDSIVNTIVRFKQSEECKEICNNGIDDDGDGRIDHMNPDCQCTPQAEYIRNGSFETILKCYELSDIEASLEHWDAVTGSPDLFHMDCYAPWAFMDKTRDFKPSYYNKYYVSFSGGGNTFESLGTRLEKPVEAGGDVHLSIDFLIQDSSFDVKEWPEGKINVYGWYNYSTMKGHKHDLCFSQNKNAEILYTIDVSALKLRSWYTLSTSIKTKRRIESISVEVDCTKNAIRNANNMLISNVSVVTRPYYNPIFTSGGKCKESVVLAVQDSSNYSYQWYKNGQPIINATSAKYEIKKNKFANKGVYSVAATSTDGCTWVESYMFTDEDFFNDTLKTYVKEKICSGDSLLFDGIWRHTEGSYIAKLKISDGCDSTVTLALSIDSNPECSKGLEEDCTNGIDDDGDGLIDYMDPDCQCDEGKEYLPNVGFNNYLKCCGSFFESDCFEYWKSFGGSPDFFTPTCVPNFYGLEEVYGKFNDTTLVHIGGRDTTWEAIGTTLLDVLDNTTEPTLTMDILLADISSPDTSKPFMGSLSVYGWYDLDTWKAYQKEKNGNAPSCFSQDGDAEVLHTIDFSKLKRSKWHKVNEKIKPTKPIVAITIENDCNNKTGSYFALIDNVSILSGPIAQPISVSEDDCDKQYAMGVNETGAYTYQWYKDGEPITNAETHTIDIDQSVPNTAGTYTLAAITADGCSINSQYKVELKKDMNQQLDSVLCKGDSLHFNNTWIKEAGNYTARLKTYNGCDSIVTMSVSIDSGPNCGKKEDCTNGVDDDGDGLIDYLDPDCQCDGSPKNLNVDDDPCDEKYKISTPYSSGMRYIWYKDSMIVTDVDTSVFEIDQSLENAAGEYLLAEINSQGCATIYAYNVTLMQHKATTLGKTICKNDSFTFGTKILKEAGRYTDTLRTATGCDSVVTLQLKVISPIEKPISNTICRGESLMVGDTILKTTGTYTIVEKTALLGCDSVIHKVNLTVHDTSLTQKHIKICDGQEVDVAGKILKVTGSYPFAYVNQYGCDSTYMIHLDVKENTLEAQLPDTIHIVRGDTITLAPQNPNFQPLSYVWKSTNLLSCDTCASINVTPDRSADYILELKDTDGCALKLLTHINVGTLDLHIPNIFSPNGDGINDVFKIYPSYPDETQVHYIRIYDRWGNNVYKADNIALPWQGWNGRDKQEQLLSGVYSYIVSYAFRNGKKRLAVGDITVVK